MKQTLLIIVALFLLSQLIRPDRTNPPVNPDEALHAPKKVETVLRRSCYDCHSNETRWPWYSNLAPFSWTIASHVKEGRLALNFSKWQTIPEKIKIKRLKRAIQTTSNNMMPLPSYLWLHKEAKLSKSDKMLLKTWFEQELAKLEQ